MIWTYFLLAHQSIVHHRQVDPISRLQGLHATWQDVKGMRIEDGSSPQLAQIANIAGVLNDFLADGEEGESPSNNPDKKGEDDDKDKDRDRDSDEPTQRWISLKLHGVAIGYPADKEIVFGTEENALRAAAGLMYWGRKVKRPVWSEKADELVHLLDSHTGFNRVYRPESHKWSQGAPEDRYATACAAMDYKAAGGQDANLERFVANTVRMAARSSVKSPWRALLLSKAGQPQSTYIKGGSLIDAIANVMAFTSEASVKDLLPYQADSGYQPGEYIDTFCAFRQNRELYSSPTPLAGAALIQAGVALDNQEYVERGVFALRSGFGLLKANALYGDRWMNEAKIPVSRMFHGYRPKDDLIPPKSWAADEGEFLAAWATVDRLYGSAIDGGKWKVGIDGIDADEKGWQHALCYTASNNETPLRGQVFTIGKGKSPLVVPPPPPFIHDMSFEWIDGKPTLVAIPSRAVQTDTPPTGSFTCESGTLDAKISSVGFEAELPPSWDAPWKITFKGQIGGNPVDGVQFEYLRPFAWFGRQDLAEVYNAKPDVPTSSRPGGIPTKGSLESNPFVACPKTSAKYAIECPSGATLQVMDSYTRQPIETLTIAPETHELNLAFDKYVGHEIYLAFRITDAQHWVEFKPA